MAGAAGAHPAGARWVRRLRGPQVFLYTRCESGACL
jgi:hypothetical protein